MTKTLSFGRYTLSLGQTPLIMGILNVTPDSFSDGGDFLSEEKASAQWQKMKAEGADIIDIGAESTRPGSSPVSAEEEIRRLSTVAESVKTSTIPVSVDTFKARTAAAALEWGADMINDVWGFQKDPEMASVAASAGCPVCLMSNHFGYPVGDDIMDDIKRFLSVSIETALKAGVKEENIILDPGIGFGMEPAQSFEVLRRLKELHSFGYPLLLGTSRKRMFATLFQGTPKERAVATAVTTAAGVAAGVDLFRVHDVRINKEAALTAAALYPNRRYPYE